MAPASFIEAIRLIVVISGGGDEKEPSLSLPSEEDRNPKCVRTAVCLSGLRLRFQLTFLQTADQTAVVATIWEGDTTIWAYEP